MKHILFGLLALSLLSSMSLSAQTIYADKTTSEGRMILLEQQNVGPSSARKDEMSLNYFSSGETEIFRLCIDFDGISKIQEGYKILLKQESGNIIELTCALATPSFKVIPFLWEVKYAKDANFLVTREQVESMIADPVIKIRVEHSYGYTDIEQYAKSQIIKKSRFSSYLKDAYNEINDALKNKKTGLYDDF